MSSFRSSFLTSTQSTLTHSESERCGESQPLKQRVTGTTLCQWPTFYNNKRFWRKQRGRARRVPSEGRGGLGSEVRVRAAEQSLQEGVQAPVALQNTSTCSDTLKQLLHLLLWDVLRVCGCRSVRLKAAVLMLFVYRSDGRAACSLSLPSSVI